MTVTEKICIRFVGIDYFERAVFITTDNKAFYKSIELMPHNDYPHLTAEEWEILLQTLHDTDEFEGEPDWPVPRERFEFVE